MLYCVHYTDFDRKRPHLLLRATMKANDNSFQCAFH